MKNISAQKLYEACMNHRFLILRYSSDNLVIAVNCKIARLTVLSKFKNINQPTKFISYSPCGFMEYITKKAPFIVSKN